MHECVNMRMLRKRSLRMQLSLFGGGVGPCFLFLKVTQVAANEKQRNRCADNKRDERLHRKNAVSGSQRTSPARLLHSSVVSQHHHQNDVNRSQQRKRVTEWPVNHVPQLEHLLRLREEQNLLRQQRLLLGE